MGTWSLTPLLTGVRSPDQGVMTYQKGYGRKIWLPIWVFLLKNNSGEVVLVDTGLAEDEVLDPPGFAEETGLASLPLSEALAAEGLMPGQVTAVIYTHLHDDHCGNGSLFAHAPAFLQQAELEFAADPHPLDHRYDMSLVEGVAFIALSGEAEPLPGIRVIPAPGHTPGIQAVVVQTGEGPAVITGFCCNQENFPERGPAVCPGVHTDALAAWDSIQMVKGMKGRILPLHALGLQEMG